MKMRTNEAKGSLHSSIDPFAYFVCLYLSDQNYSQVFIDSLVSVEDIKFSLAGLLESLGLLLAFSGVHVPQYNQNKMYTSLCYAFTGQQDGI